MFTSPEQRILVVDDDAIIVRILERTLQRHGFEVFTAYDGQDGLQKAQDLVPDLVVLDVMMPYINGFDVCQKLKANPDTAEIRVLILTALGAMPTGEPNGSSADPNAYRQQAITVGADDFMSKPVQPKRLLNRVEALMRKERVTQ